MKSFEELYNEVLENCKDELEGARKKVLFRIIIAIVLGIVVNIAVLMFVQNGFVSMIVLLVSIFAGVFWVNKPGKEYTKIYKDKVVRAFIKDYSKDLSYEPEGKIPSSVYRQAGFETYYDRYSSEDVIRGNIDNHEIIMGEVHTEREEETTDSDGNTTTTYVTIFHGMFGSIKINNLYNGVIKVHSDSGKLGKIFGDKKRVEMDSSEFEKYFDVYGDDKIQVMQVLTSDILEQMISFVKEKKIKFELTIDRDNLYIRFKTGDMFEANILKSSVNLKTLKKVYDIINFTFDITRALVKVSEETDI